MRYLKQNTAVIVSVGPFYDKTDGVTIETGLTITNERITLVADTDDGSAPTNILDNVTGATSGTDNDLNYITNNDAGMMQLELSAANTNRLGRLLLSITDAANHVPVFHEFTILPTQVYDSLILGTDLLQIDAQQLLGTAYATPTVAGVQEVDVTHLNGVAQSLQDLKDFADDGYDPATNKVQGVVLTDTLTTYTGNTVQTGDSFARLGAPAGASVSADIAAIEAQTDDIGVAGAGLTALVDLVWDELRSGHSTLGSFGESFYGIISTTVEDAAATTTSFITGLTEATNDHYNGRIIIFIDGALYGQSTDITDYVGATKAVTVTALTEAPGDGDRFIIV